MNAILTGSHKYGTPGPNSDVDIVLFMSQHDCSKLWEKYSVFNQNGVKVMLPSVIFTVTHLQKAWIKHLSPLELKTSFPVEDYVKLNEIGKTTFGYAEVRNVNLIPTFELDRFNGWVEGTQQLAARKPVTREEAIRVFNEIGVTGGSG